MRLLTVLRIAVPVLVIAVAIAAFFFLPVRHYFQEALRSVEALGSWGLFLLILLYLLAALFLLPSSVLTIGTGLVYGVLWGTGAAVLGITLGALGPFVVGRTLAREWINRKIQGHPKFQAIDRAVGKEGFKMVFLTRLSPLFPYPLMNYVFAVTRVSWWDYLLGTFFGMFPGTLLYAYLGSAARTLLDLATGEARGGIWGQILFAVGLVAAIGVSLFTTWYAKKELDEEMGPRRAEESTQNP